jgi:tetratricopeptide (TPR) repeat protein
VLTAASCAITWYAQNKGGAIQSFTHIPLGMRLANAVVACTSYLAKMVWPVDLAVFYPHPRAALSATTVTVAATILIAITAVAVKLAKQQPYLIVGWLWYLGTLVPVLGLVQVGKQAMADRYTYVPLIGIFIALSWEFAELFVTRWRWAAVVFIPASVIVFAFCLMLTWLQVSFWQDSYTLWQHAADFTVDNAVAHNHLGAIYQDHRQLEDAEAHFREALRIDPDDIFAHNNLGWLLLSKGKTKEAIVHFETAVRFESRFGPALAGLGQALDTLAAAYAEEGRFDEAIATQRKALQPMITAVNPAQAEKRQERLSLYENRQPLKDPPQTAHPEAAR